MTLARILFGVCLFLSVCSAALIIIFAIAGSKYGMIISGSALAVTLLIALTRKNIF